MPLQKLQFRPGVNRETTSYSNEGGWFDCNLVRFRMGVPEKIKGWTKFTDTAVDGLIRGIRTWADFEGDKLIGVGTSKKYYVYKGGSLNNITPIRKTSTGLSNPIATTSGSTTATVTDASHGAVLGDFVTLSGASDTGGVTAANLNKEHEITSITSNNAYTITVASAASSTVSSGGGTVGAVYQINTGLDTQIVGTGWGAAPWNTGAWGDEYLGSDILLGLRLISHDILREDLIFNIRDEGIYYWDTSANRSSFASAVHVNSISGADGFAPTNAKQILVSDIDRHVIAFGCTPVEQTLARSGNGEIDPLLIRFSDANDATIWNPDIGTNSAGDILLASGNEIVSAVHTRQETLVFTDASLYSMQNIGPPLIFVAAPISGQTTIMGPNSAVAVDGVVFWMGKENFYLYSGSVQKIDCTVRSKVFNDFNFRQSAKVFASVNSTYNEVWWFYPSASSENNDKYVVYNYQEQLWYFGDMPRTAWADRGIYEYPLAASTDGFIYEHERDLNDGSTSPASGLNSFIESSQMDIGDGEQFTFVSRVIHDVTFDGSSTPNPKMNVVLKSRNFPGANFTETSTSSVTKTATLPVEQFTEKSDVRLRGRSFAFRYESSETDVQWRAGSPRVNVRTDGKR